MKHLILIITTLLLIAISYSQEKTILFVMSAEDTLALNNNTKLRQTGVFLNEFYLAYKSVTEAGYKVKFATPSGIKATIDKESKNDTYWKNKLETKKEALKFIKANVEFHTPMTLEKAIATRDQYLGLIIPGGQGLMIDLLHDEHIPILLKHFAKNQKPTGLICHAPILISTIPKEENPYVGYKINSVSPLEEFVIEKFIMKGKPKSRKIAKTLKKLGLKYRNGFPKANFSIKDRNLVTSQNPYSNDAFNELFLKALLEYNQVIEIK
ncbi:DJ-1/PfpI family protein [Seonamhaeicola sp. MEBiC1930]|uniref:DJ-1/PfpI family protein n=1 Tax=Seonamhaeicola sp. MEBiC01930 TaxID=2976768 RepID=UPI00324E9650